ncbi:hypothetical protein HanIR_Chr06g0286221 [Helianthus annuus]|nr:hypothetical protein HanIR_Chr06g0286221 [Helianthus annuus]
MVIPKNLGGFGVGDIKITNLALLAKWWWVFKNNPSSLWAKVEKAIHSSKRSIQFIPAKNKVCGIWKTIVAIDKKNFSFKLAFEVTYRLRSGGWK